MRTNDEIGFRIDCLHRARGALREITSDYAKRVVEELEVKIEELKIARSCVGNDREFRLATRMVNTRIKLVGLHPMANEALLLGFALEELIWVHGGNPMVEKMIEQAFRPGVVTVPEEQVARQEQLADGLWRDAIWRDGEAQP